MLRFGALNIHLRLRRRQHAQIEARHCADGVEAGRREAPEPAPGLSRPRIGVVRGGWTCTDDVIGALTATARDLVRSGFDVVEIDPGVFVAAGHVFDTWRATDDYADLRALASARESELTQHISDLLSWPTIGTLRPTKAES